MHSERLFLRLILLFAPLILVLTFSDQSAVGQVWTGASTGTDLWSDDALSLIHI